MDEPSGKYTRDELERSFAEQAQAFYGDEASYCDSRCSGIHYGGQCCDRNGSILRPESRFDV